MQRLFLLAPLLLAGCSGDAIGPSLAKRPIEGRDLSEPVRQALPPPAADAALRSQIAGLTEQARAGQRAFAELLPRARSAAAAGGAEGSESWIAAQELLSALESARAPSTKALSELDSLIATRLNAGNETGIAELQAADTEIAGLVNAQQEAFDSLRERLSR